jgi:3-oxoacyl-[acyl-carrier protein] reductase
MSTTKPTPPPRHDLTGRTALVTGAAGAIGAAIALRLAEQGAEVALNDLHGEALTPVADTIRRCGREALCLPADVADEAQVHAMFETIDARFGGISILVNNAGISYQEDIFSTTLERWNRVLAVHLTGTFLCSREAMRRMRERRWGRIIQISSVVAHRGAMYGFVHYASAKAGQLGFTRTLARTGAPYGITVNAVAPGIVDTPMFRETHGTPEDAAVTAETPLGISAPEDIAAAVAFVASEEARHITGAVIDVNGGLYFR